MSNSITITIPRTAIVLSGVVALALVIVLIILDWQSPPEEDSGPDLGVLTSKNVVFVVAIDAGVDASGKVRLLAPNGRELTPCKPIGEGKFQDCDLEDITVKKTDLIAVQQHTGSSHPCTTIYFNGLPVQIHAAKDPNPSHTPKHWWSGQMPCHANHTPGVHNYP